MAKRRRPATAEDALRALMSVCGLSAIVRLADKLWPVLAWLLGRPL